MCLAGTVVASSSLIQELAGSNSLLKIKYILLLNSVKTFRENSNRFLSGQGSFVSCTKQ